MLSPDSIAMRNLFTTIQEHIGNLKNDDFSVEVSVDPRNINPKTILLLYHLINSFESSYFIILKNIPYCLMPDAIEHIIHEKVKDRRYYYDGLCKSCYLKQECLGWSNLINLKRNTIAKPKQLLKEIIFEITKRCNLGCVNCPNPDKHTVDIDYITVKRTVDKIVKLGVKNVRFTGGEPLLHNKIEEMIIYAKNRGCYVTLNTNATLFNDQLIKSIGKNADNILVSLQGFNQTSERLLTKNCSLFQRKLTNIFKLKRKSYGIVRIGTVISKTLVNNFGMHLRLIKRLGIDNWEIYRPLPGNHHNQHITKKDFQIITNHIYHLRHSGLKIKIGNPLPFCINNDIRLSKLFFLGGIVDEGRLVLDADGYFKPNYFTDYNLGKHLETSWKKLILINKQSRENLTIHCKNCESLKWCQGGFGMIKSRANRIFYFNDPLAPKS